ncbi:MAG TPA: hypothetical protein VFI31_11515 [Pirellulales bacterium]|nr:hypothetical protein [Pirellulales bacterium]
MNLRRLFQVCVLFPLVVLACAPCLLAQQQFPNQFGQPGQEIPPELIGVWIAIIVVALIVGLAIAIVIAVLISGCYARIPQQYRDMEPGMVYLMLIPCLNIVWVFFVTLRLSTSFQKYFAAHGRTDVGDCGYQLGLWYSICVVASIVPCVNYVAGPASLVLLILFLVKVMGLKNQIPVGATS